MKLKSLLDPKAEAPHGIGDIDVAGITSDSRAVEPGFIFAALSGSKSDGARFIPAAIAAGARLIVCSRTALFAETGGIPVLRVEDPRRELALMAACFYRAQPETIVAVTGTQGKTSIANFTRQIWALAGIKAASLGTIGLVRPDGSVQDSLTTPEPVALHTMLNGLVADGVTHLAMEASSHGLEQRRLDGVRLAAGAFINIGHDHLDYHADMEDYFAQKRRLFRTLLPEGAGAVINADAERADEVIDDAYGRDLKVMTVGKRGKTVKLESRVSQGFNQRLVVRFEGERYEIDLPLIGDYQASNALMAAGLCLATGSPPEGVFAQLSALKGVPGRLEMAGTSRGGMVVIDYAHKPDALRAALAALRPFVTGKLICLFGCGGDRDRLKRPIMGGIASELADAVIVTDDNPRTEVPASIRAEIMAGANGATEIGDRRAAIHAAVAMLGPGDVLLVAGKGHETGQYVGDLVLPFSDHQVVAEALLAEVGVAEVGLA
jgi:UDP-N-acetylmuramoyl-L-alanyl-D-glutamate--2,6-diaminopimelate ligase